MSIIIILLLFFGYFYCYNVVIGLYQVDLFDSVWKPGLGRGGHATWDQQIVVRLSVLPSDALASSSRQNGALPYLKAQDGTTLNVVF